jgi:FkbM family methyltransferase
MENQVYTEVQFPLGRKLKVLESRAAKINFAELEREFIENILRRIEPNDVIFDIGSEQGEFSALLAKETPNVHLFEPTPEMWANLNGIFKANELPEPHCFHGFVSDKTSESVKYGQGFEPCGGEIQHESMFSVIIERLEIQNTTIDDYVTATKCVPNIIMMDIEGAEVLAVKGAQATLSQFSPTIYVSLHPDIFIERFGVTQPELFDLMSKYGYSWTFLHYDHECHWRFDKLERLQTKNWETGMAHYLQMRSGMRSVFA